MRPGEMLPGEHDLAAVVGVSRMTLRRALARLEEEGRVSRRRGDGTRVCPAPVFPGSGRTADTLAQLLQMGRQMTTRALSVEEVAAPPNAALGLDLPPAARARRADLVRLMGDVPVSHLSAFFPASPQFRSVTRSAIASRPLLALTEELGGPVRELTQTVSAVLADPGFAKLLALDAGSPLVRIERRLVGRNGPLQYSIAHYRADCFSVETVEVMEGKRWRREVRMKFAERDGQRGEPAA